MGYRWRIGNGSHFYINQGPWLNKKDSRFPLSVPEALKWTRVQDLMLENGEWNVPLIQSSFILADSEDILTIPLSRTDSKDEIIWNLEPKGVFSVKSAYHLAYQLSVSNEVSGSNSDGSKIQLEENLEDENHAKGQNLSLEDFK